MAELGPKFLYYKGERPLYLISEAVAHGEERYLELAPEQIELVQSQGLDKFVVREGLLELKTSLPHRSKRVVMICDWGVTCGIATYSDYLAKALEPSVGELWVLAEDAANVPDEPRVIRCWDRRGEYSKICAEVEKINPDLIIIQHEYGLFHKHNKWSALMSQLSRWRTLVVMHTVLEHRVESEEASRDYLSRCLTEAACPEIVVHSPKARQTLRSRGYSGRVHYIPHGCFKPDPDNKLPAQKYGMYPEHTIFQYGFGSSHKGWDVALDVVAELKVKYPDVFYLGMFSISEFARQHQTAYYYDLLDKVRARGLEHNFAIHKGFQTDDMLSQLIRCSKVALYPYQVPNRSWASWGASGAIQIPLSLGVPLVMSRFPQFQEFDGVLPLCETVADYVAVIDRIFSDKVYETKLSRQAHAIAEARRWDVTALRFLECSPFEDYETPKVEVLP